MFQIICITEGCPRGMLDKYVLSIMSIVECLSPRKQYHWESVRGAVNLPGIWSPGGGRGFLRLFYTYSISSMSINILTAKHDYSRF